jgi:DNA-binding response OmpR family regulator
MRVLIVEDSEELADLLAQGLQAAGYEIDLLASVSDASSALGTTRYAALILDLGLPDGDGLSILRFSYSPHAAAWKIGLTAFEAERMTISSSRSPLTNWWRGSKHSSGARDSCSAVHCGFPT